MTPREWIRQRAKYHLQNLLNRAKVLGISGPEKAEDLRMDLNGLIVSELAIAHARVDLIEQAMNGLQAERAKRTPGPVSEAIN